MTDTPRQVKPYRRTLSIAARWLDTFLGNTDAATILPKDAWANSLACGGTAPFHLHLLL